MSAFDLLVLSQIPQIGSNRLRLLVSHFGAPENIYTASAREISAVEGFSKKLASMVVHFLKNSKLDEAKRYAEKQLSKLNKVDGKIVSFWEKRYPEPLKKIYDPPPYFYLRGQIAETDKYSLAIVGTRTPSDYGITMAERFSRDCASIGITVVSGLARGIDTVAHQTAVKSSGRTIAVIGSGLDVCYPPENRNLMDRIISNGAVVSEYEMGAKPDAVNFPRRNRIISGLSLGTLVVETDVDGGAIITTNMALDQNREVFAIPGNINAKKSRGCNMLIKESKAKLVETMDDILAELSGKLKPLIHTIPQGDQEKAMDGLNLFERKVYDALSFDALHIDLLAERCHMPTADVLVHLLALEFKGIVKQLPGKTFLKMF